MQDAYYTNTIALTGTDPEAKRRELREYFTATYEQYEKLFDLLADESAYYAQPNAQRHPIIFYFGHTAAFFINKLVVAKLTDRRINPEYESIFAIGVDEMEWDDLESAHYRWPELAKVRAYRDAVKAFVLEMIDAMELTLPIGWDDPAWIILMGIEHERIHLETSSMLFRELPVASLRPNALWPLCPEQGDAVQNELLEVPEGVVLHHADIRHPEYYGWDNEFGFKRTEVAGFKASRYLVSNGEFLPFVRSGGYTERRFWDDEGWRWVEQNGVTHPHFWVPEGEGYRYRALAQEIPMPWNWPVDVNALEAKAFCNWLSEQTGESLRLPTEDEWYRLHQHTGVRRVPPFGKDDGNINLTQYASATPVTANRHGEFYDVIGNVWQWCETAMHPFEGFVTHPVYDDFTVPTFDGKHAMIKGGSWISTGNETLARSRFAFRRHFHQHAGFRYVSGGQGAQDEIDIYETDGLISQYCEFHYGEEYFGVANFPRAMAELANEVMQGRRKGRALDLGCAVGRASFELGRYFDEVEGVDFSTRFIRHAIELKEKGRLAYYLKEEGELTRPVTRSLASFGLKGGNVAFWQGDACNLKSIFTGYDLIMALNLIDRLYDPALFLGTVHERLNEGGVLILSSPYTWQDDSTPKDKWLGGYRDGEHPVYTLEGLERLLGGRFELIRGPEAVEFVIRETKRKFQHSLSEVTVWVKR